MRLYWPTGGLVHTEGDIVGWKTGSARVVVAIVPSVKRYTRVDSCQEHQLSLSSPSPAPRSHNLVVLGIATQIRRGASMLSLPQTTAESLLVWLDDRVPVATSHPAAQVILYNPPDNRRLRFFSISSHPADRPAGPIFSTFLAGQDEYSSLRQRGSRSVLDEVVPLLNMARGVQLSLLNDPSNTSRNDQNATRDWDAPVPASWLLPSFLSSRSAALGQIALRTKQVGNAPSRFGRTLHDPSVPLAQRSKYYMKFWNTVWLILNDLILGHLARQFLLAAAHFLSIHMCNAFTRYAIQAPLDTLTWLNDWPIGLKLNTPLSAFFCTALGHIITTWSDLLSPVLQTFSADLVVFLSIASLGGLTLCISVFRDLLRLAALHLEVCYMAMALICRWQLTSLGALWNLFRGKRWNVLRQRTDSYAYDVDQLFLGTLLFTVSLFLLPTVAVYASFFYATHLSLWLVDLALRHAVIALNAFPLFEMMLRVKEPSRLPAGLSFSVKTVRTGGNFPPDAIPVHRVLHLKNSSKSFTEILRPAKER